MDNYQINEMLKTACMGKSLSFVKKEIAKLSDILSDDETIVAALTGMRSDNNTRLAVLTNKRFLLLYCGLTKSEQNDYPLSAVSGVSVKSGMLMAKLSIVVPGYKIDLSQVDKELASHFQSAFNKVKNSNNTNDFTPPPYTVRSLKLSHNHQ